jgi:phage terminase small subunit|tara:strand:- start:7297 stop:7662 length:366 start_codon:yes stop_codon:yes gene_type:complete
MAHNLTEKQQKFLDVLFTDECRGDPVAAIKVAGYAPNTSSTKITSVLQEEIAELTKKFIASSGSKAAWAMSEVMASPTDLGNKEKIVAAKDLLDRAGFAKTDKIEVKAANPLFILPEKEDG